MLKALIFINFLQSLPLFILQDTIVVTESHTAGTVFIAPYFYSVSTLQSSNDFLFSNALIFRGINYSSMSIGGTAPEQNSILFAGIYLPNAMLGYTDPSLLPLSSVKYVEVLNSSSPLLSFPGIGGTLNLVPDNTPLKLKISNYEKNINSTFKINPKIRIGFSYETFVDSYKVNIDNLSFFVNNTGYKKLGFLMEDTEGKNSLILVRRDAGAPSPLGGIYHGHRSEILEGTKISFPLPHGIGVSLNQSAFYQVYTSPSQIDTHFVANVLMNFRWKFFQGSYSLDFAKSTKIGSKSRQKLTIGAKNLEIYTSLLTVHPSFIFILTKNQTQLIPLYSIALSKNINRTFFVFTSYSRTYREPTFNELYWPEDPFARGNTKLYPEKGTNVDLGFRIATGNTLLSGTTFFKYISNAIVWIQEDKYTPVNYSVVRHYGVNFSLFHSRGSISTDLNINVQKSYLSDMPYLYRPEISLNALIKVFFTSFSFTYIGKRPERPNSTKMMPPIYLLSTSVVKKFELKNLEIEISGGAENLLDVNYSLIPGYPQPGRSFYLEMEIRR
ncbi:MAG: TonB-dependent receptor domain-containing protein [Candidatus Hydrothermia bacterium]